MDLFEKTLSSEYKFKGRIINLRVDEIELPNGEKSNREIVEHNGGVCIAPITSDGKLLFVKQFRYPYSEVVLELPAGKRNKDEDPLECGKRELKEETGATGENYKFLGELYPTPGYCGEIIYIYCCDVVSLGDQHLDDDEFVNVEAITIEKAKEMVMNNEIPDSKTQVAILKIANIMGK